MCISVTGEHDPQIHDLFFVVTALRHFDNVSSFLKSSLLWDVT